MDGYLVFDEVGVVIFRYGDPGDNSLDLQINYCMSWPFKMRAYQNRLAQELQFFLVHFPNMEIMTTICPYIHIWGLPDMGLILMTSGISIQHGHIRGSPTITDASSSIYGALNHSVLIMGFHT